MNAVDHPHGGGKGGKSKGHLSQSPWVSFVNESNFYLAFFAVIRSSLLYQFASV